MLGDRLGSDFEMLQQLGAGAFGTICLHRHRLDGILYAIKRSKQPVRGAAHEQKLLREVYAHAVLQQQDHVVRYAEL